MATVTHRHFSSVEYLTKLRAANFTEEQADIIVEGFEHQQQLICEQQFKLDNLSNKELATKQDLELAIEKLRYATLKFVVWTGVGVSFTLIVVVGGMLAKGFHWF
jgi:hypothetical protein